MEGVTILNTFEVVERAPGWTWWALIPIILTIVAIIGVYVADYICEPGVSIMLAFGAIVFMVASAFVILTGKELPPETRYNVIVDESVSFTEFNEKYEVIEQEGRIYTVKEKE